MNGYAVVTGVRDELYDYGGNEKIQNTHELEEELDSRFGRLYNQLKGSPREMKLGSLYYRDLNYELYTEEIRSDRGDANILAACEEFHDSKAYDLLMFSEDSEFIEQAQTRRVPSHLIEFQRTLPRRATVSWDDLAVTLYLQAILFGILDLPGVDVYGVWQGKKGQNWKDHELRLDCSSPKIYEKLRQVDADRGT